MPDRSVLLAGLTFSDAVSSDAWVAKIDNAGDLLWEKKYGGVGRQRVSSLLLLPNGEFLALGSTDVEGIVRSDAGAFRADSNGKQLWQKTLGKEVFATLKDMTTLPGGDILLAGTAT